MRKGMYASVLAAVLTAPFAANAAPTNISFVNGGGNMALQPDAGFTPTTPCGSSPDICAASLTFSNLGGTGVDATATASGGSFASQVWYDQAPNFGGLGVVAGPTDNIDPNDAVTLTFSQEVALLDWSAFNHRSSGGLGGSIHDLIVDGVNVINNALVQNAGNIAAPITGTTFKFKHDGHRGGFYVSALAFDVPTTVKVPEPATMLLIGAGLLGFAGARRRAA